MARGVFRKGYDASPPSFLPSFLPRITKASEPGKNGLNLWPFIGAHSAKTGEVFP